MTESRKDEKSTHGRSLDVVKVNKAGLTVSQIDCLERRGICAGCPQNPRLLGLSSLKECKVKNTPRVAKELGTQPLNLKTMGRPRAKPKVYLPTCWKCFKEFPADSLAVRYCPECDEKRKSESG